jgi:hypothetical protein
MTMMSILRRGRSGRGINLALTLVAGLLAGYAGSPISVLLVISGGPAVLTGIAAVAALASIVAIVMLYRPDTKAFLNPDGVPARPGGLGALFGARPPRAPRPGLARAAGPAEATSPVPTEAPKSRAKVRSDNDAIAKGAELARSRAKASKSRRSVD